LGDAEEGTGPPGPNDNHPGLDIIWVPWTEAHITVWKADHPNGVVVLNDNPPPHNTDPIKTDVHPNVRWKWATGPDEPVDLIRDAGWPAAEIILWQGP
jgi:hypothetical protein